METSKPDAELIHLIRLVNRITYGANRQLLDVADSMGYEGFLEWQLNPDSFDDSELEGVLTEFLPTLTMDIEALYDFVFEQENFGAAQRDLIIATLIRRIFSPRQLFERMVEFWSDHFSVPVNSTILGVLKSIEDRDVMRTLALERFATLVQADAKSPAMLYYLDNFNNTVAGPNENYARELLELHTMGVDGGYTEADIKEVARVFTGWTIRPPGKFVFNPAAHDWDAKEFLGRPIAAHGISEGEHLLSVIATHPSTARHVATKLARRFVADTPDPEVVETVADTFELTGGDVPSLLRSLLLHPRVIETAPVKFKRPNEFLGGIARALEAELSEKTLTAIFAALDTSGQTPFGWPAPDGYPDQRDYWQSTNGFLMRFNSAFDWTDQLAVESPVLREAAAIDYVPGQIEVLAGTLRPQGLEPVTRRLMIRYANRLSESERAAALAAFLLADPDAQWR